QITGTDKPTDLDRVTNRYLHERQSAVDKVLDRQVIPAGGTDGQVLTKASDNDYDVDWETPGSASGTVTSVGLTVPAEFSVSGSPVTTSGTLAVSKANQSANLVYAGPSSGAAAAPTFRALVTADIPAGGLVLISKQVASGSSASITFSSIPQTYTDLIITFWGRTTSNTYADNSLYLRMNGDNNSSHYGALYYYGWFGSGSAQAGTVVASSNGVNFLYCPGTSSSLSATGNGEGVLLNYTQTAFYKFAQSTSMQFNGSQNIATRGFWYVQPNAITQLELIN